MTASNPAGGRAPCRFCDQVKPGVPRMPGPVGPVCAGCIEVGLRLLRDGRQSEAGGSALVRLRSAEDAPCEFCDRRERRTFLGFRRSLRRMARPAADAVVCLDCLDRGGDLINRAARH
ncbi:MAG: hypothetical protein ACRDRN_09155 [Sciscionella sp.]